MEIQLKKIKSFNMTQCGYINGQIELMDNKNKSYHVNFTDDKSDNFYYSKEVDKLIDVLENNIDMDLSHFRKYKYFTLIRFIIITP
jgi:ATP phosphoribosyltransferase regulatory subunit HisZ